MALGSIVGLSAFVLLAVMPAMTAGSLEYAFRYLAAGAFFYLAPGFVIGVVVGLLIERRPR